MIGENMRKVTMFITAVWLTLAVSANPFCSATGQTESTLFVTVTDDLGRLVTGLESKNFTVFENDEPRALTSFSVDETPHSLGVAWHFAGGLPNRLAGLRESLKQLAGSGNSDNDVFVASDALLNNAITSAQNQLLQSRHNKRALLVLTDVSEANDDALREVRVPVYFVGLNEASAFSPKRQAELQELAQATGGKAVFIDSTSELSNALARVGLELEHQYRLGYAAATNGKVRVALHTPRGLPALTVRVGRNAFSR
jgi:hypothetical protein